MPDDENIVSLYDLGKLMNYKYTEYNNLIKKYQDYIQNKINQIYPNDIRIKLHNFNYKKQVLIISCRSKNSEEETMIFTKSKDEELVLNCKKTELSNKIISVLEADILDIYDKFMEYNEFMTEYVYYKKIINSNFEFTVYDTCIFMTYKNNIGLLDNFDLTYYNKDNSYEIDTTYKNIYDLVNDNEEKIFKNLYINIKDCPEWSRKFLHNIENNSKCKNLRYI